jgi:hypothetical protein
MIKQRIPFPFYSKTNNNLPPLNKPRSLSHHLSHPNPQSQQTPPSPIDLSNGFHLSPPLIPRSCISSPLPLPPAPPLDADQSVPSTVLTQDDLKKLAAIKAVEYVSSGMVLGLAPSLQRLSSWPKSGLYCRLVSSLGSSECLFRRELLSRRNL